VELRSLRILAMGVLGLAAALLLPVVQVYVLSVMALCPLALLAAGQFYLPRSKRAIQVWFNPIVIELDDELISPEPGIPLGRLSGKELTYSIFKQWHEFEVVTHRHWLLAGIGFFSLGSFWLVWWTKDSLFNGVGLFYLAGSIWAMVVLLARRWLWERRALRHTGLSIGSFSVTAGGRPPGNRQIRYHFVDPEGEYRGGMLDSLYCDQADDMTLVFFNEADPDQSVPASALMFHKLVWKESPATRVVRDLEPTVSEDGGAGK
jgi:hypothetical protein